MAFSNASLSGERLNDAFVRLVGGWVPEGSLSSPPAEGPSGASAGLGMVWVPVGSSSSPPGGSQDIPGSSIIYF